MNQLTIQLLDFYLAQLNKRPNITFEKKKKKIGCGGHGSPSSTYGSAFAYNVK